MRDSAPGRRYLLWGGWLLAVLLALVTPAAAQGPTVGGQDLTVFGLSPLFQAGIAAFCLFSAALIMLVSFGGYTERTTDIVLADPRGAMTTGLRTAIPILIPYIGLVAVMVVFDAIGMVSLVLLAVLTTPLVVVTLTAAVVGLVAAGRRASEKEGVQLATVVAIALPIGAFPIPFVLLGAGVTLYGLGAIVWDLRYGKSGLESSEHESYARQHRYS